MSDDATDDRTLLNAPDVAAEGLTDWRFRSDTLHASFPTGSFMVGVRLVNAIADAAEAANHHPDITLTYPSVGVRLRSHDVDGVTPRDVRLARQISALAAAAGAAPRLDESDG